MLPYDHEQSTVYSFCNVLIQTSRRRFELDNTVRTLCRRYHYNIHDIKRGEFFIQRRGNVSTILWFDIAVLKLRRRRCKFNVVISALQKCCQNNIHNTSWVKPRYFTYKISWDFRYKIPWLNLLSNVETTLEQRCNSDVVVLTKLQRCVLVKWRYDLATTSSQSCLSAG